MSGLPGAPVDDARVALDGLRQALVARHLLRRERTLPGASRGDHGQDEIVLIDPTTGRLAHGTQWTRGVHQLVALKEGLAPPPAA